MKPRVVLVDLGGTLVDYFGHTTPGNVLPRALESAGRVLVRKGRAVPSIAVMEARWGNTSQRPNDSEVRALEFRLATAFGIGENDPLMSDLCPAFMRPLFEQARLYEDALPFLEALRDLGIEAIIVSNTTWGSPAELWREQLEIKGIARRVRGSVFCRDVGWRKPDARIFAHALKVAQADPEECLFIGDNPVWDVDGPRDVGIAGILLDRRAEFAGHGYDRAYNLWEIIHRLQL